MNYLTVKRPASWITLAAIANVVIVLGAGAQDSVKLTHWSPWTSDGVVRIENANASVARGLRCRGNFCDDLALLNETPHGVTQFVNSEWTQFFSEEGEKEGRNQAVCGDGRYVTGLECQGQNCDSMRLRCSLLNNGGFRDRCYWSPPISDEGEGNELQFAGPEGMFVAGMKCTGRFCDQVQLYMCQAQPSPALNLADLAARFAPQLRFDQQATSPGRCLPSNAADYYQLVTKNHASDDKVCNTDSTSLGNRSVSTYYVAGQVGLDEALIRYWFFYARDAGHTADWESMQVLVSGNKLVRVSYFMHSSWVTRAPGAFDVVDGTHPVGYVGLDHHATYFDTGGNGGALTFDDYRHPGDLKLDTWSKLVPI